MILNFFNDLFATPQIPNEKILHLEKRATNLIVYAIPFMAFFTLLEMEGAWYNNPQLYKVKEGIGSMLVGLGNVLINL